jgi:hypothetical protein
MPNSASQPTAAPLRMSDTFFPRTATSGEPSRYAKNESSMPHYELAVLCSFQCLGLGSVSEVKIKAEPAVAADSSRIPVLRASTPFQRPLLLNYGVR